jgi:hypothetical protein
MGVKPPIHGSLRPNHHGEACATHNLARKEKVGKRCGRGAVATRDGRREEIKELWKNTQSD